MYDKPNDSLCIYHLPTADIIAQTVLYNETVCTSLCKVSHEITNSPLALIRIISKIDRIFFLPWVLYFYYTMLNFFFFF